jgi:hypothetical protein
MTRPQYLQALAHARRIIDLYELEPMTFAASPGKVSRALLKWSTASDEERAEAKAFADTPDY